MRVLAIILLFGLTLESTAANAACDSTCQAQFVTEHNRVRTKVNDGLMPAPSGFQPNIQKPYLVFVSTLASSSSYE